MHRTIATVFKILILSVVFSFTLDTALIFVDIITVHSRVSNVVANMQTEVASNNCMPTMLVSMFEASLDDIENQSRIMDTSKSTSLVKIKTNMKSGYTASNGVTYKALTPENAGDYGSFVEVAVTIEMNPTYVYFRSDTSTLARRASKSTIKVDYIYTVPCLRYLK